MKKVRERIGKITYQKVMAVLFLVFIFYIAAVMLPRTVDSAGTLYRDKSGILEVRDTVDEEYREMLEFQGALPKNKATYINLNGLMARLMGQRYVNERVKLDNGHLSYLYEKTDFSLDVLQMTKLSEKQKARGKHFLFVIAPNQNPKNRDILPAGYAEYSNQDADEMASRLRANGVSVLDLRDELINDGISWEDAFFVADHHWKPETGFWAYAKIIKRFEEMGVIEPADPKLTDIGEYNQTVYEDWFVGSSGIRTGYLYSGLDDFTLITPKFKTDLTYSNVPDTVMKRGSFDNVALGGAVAQKDYFNYGPYSIYGNGDQAFKRYTNPDAGADIKLLSIGDSFSNVPFAFLPLAIGRCDELDMRYYDGDFASYYAQYAPDAVLVLINAGTLSQENTHYDFFGDLGEQSK